MCDRWLNLFDPILHKAAIAAATLIASLIIGLATTLPWPHLTLDQLIALSASLGSSAAALATYLTVREMKAGRILNARARLTTPGTDQHIGFEWQRSPKNLVHAPSKVRVIVRNASQGVAQKIRILWRVENPLTSADIDQIQKWMPDNQSITITGGHSAHFCDSGVVSSMLVVGGESSQYLGDLGPNQELYTEVPPAVLNSVFLSWLRLLVSVAEGEIIEFAEVPSVAMIMEHSSPYEPNITDHHRIRFELVDERFKLRAVKSPAEALGGAWKSFQITLAFETTSRTMYEIPRVVV